MQSKLLISQLIIWLHASVLVVGDGIGSLSALTRRLEQANDQFTQPLMTTLIDEDAYRNFTQLVESRQFQAQVHKVITEDRYVLTLHRLINPLLDDSERAKLKPVILHHGLVMSADDFVINALHSIRPMKNVSQHERSLERTIGMQPPDTNGTNTDGPQYTNSLAYLLANRGYDVWLPNSRGNTYSIEHLDYETLDPRFWSFSIDEMIQYDLPAVIAYIQKETGQKKLSYVGHSQGSAIMFGLLSSRPEYADIIEPFVAMAPVAYLDHITSPVRHINAIRSLTQLINLPLHDINLYVMKYLTQIVCATPKLNLQLCTNILFLAAGINDEQYDENRVAVLMHHIPSGTSLKNINHYGQLISSGKFQMYDYGILGNMATYRQATPPEYDVAKIRSRSIAFIRSLNDWLSTPTDVVHLRNALSVPLYDDYEIRDHKWTHLDFLYAKQSGLIVNQRVLKILDDFNHPDDNHMSNDHSNAISMNNTSEHSI